MSPVVSIFMI